MTGHAQLKFVMTECSKAQIRLRGSVESISFSKNMIYIRTFPETELNISQILLTKTVKLMKIMCINLQFLESYVIRFRGLQMFFVLRCCCSNN